VGDLVGDRWPIDAAVWQPPRWCPGAAAAAARGLGAAVRDVVEQCLQVDVVVELDELVVACPRERLPERLRE
jgi:hypothetical protein